MMRPITTQNLNCAGKSAEGEQVNLSITSSRNGGTVLVDGFSNYPVDQLMVVSEGSVYMSVVMPRSFNLILFGPNLSEILSGETETAAVKLTGRIDFMRGQQFNLQCKGEIAGEALD